MSFTQISAVTEKAFIPRLVDNVFNSNPLFARMYRRITLVDGGTQIVQPVLLAQTSTVGSYSGADMLSVAPSDEVNAAAFDWCQYYATIQLTGLDDLINSGEQAVINLVKTKIVVAEKSLRDTMGSHLYLDGTGNGGKNLLGLAAAVDDGTNVATYGGLSRTTYPAWGSVYSANGGTGRALTLSLMQTQFGNASKDNERPNLILTSHGVYNKYMSLLQPGQRFMDSETASAGFQNLLYQGRPLVVDEQIATTPNHKMWMLNDKYFEFFIHRDRNFRWVPFQMLQQQDMVIAKILFAGQLICNAPRLQVQLRDLDPTL